MVKIEVLLAVAVVAVGVQGVTYELTNTDQGVFSLKQGSGSVADTLVWEEEKNPQYNRTTFDQAYMDTAKVPGDPATSPLQGISYSAPAQNSTNSTISAFVTQGNNSDRIYEVTSSTYYVEFYSYAPYIMFVTFDPSTSSLHECSVVLGISGPSGSTFSCGNSTNTNLARYEQILASDVQGVRSTSITFYVDDSLPQVFHTAYIDIGVQRLFRWHQMEGMTASIKDKNDKRTKEARITTAFLFLAVALGMFVWSLIAGLLFAWLVQPIPVHAKIEARFSGEAGKVKFNTVILSAIAVVINFTVSGAAGFTGWFVIGVLYFLLIIGIAIYTCVIRIKHRKDPSPSSSVQPEVETAPDSPAQGEEAKPDDEVKPDEENRTSDSCGRDENWLASRGNLAHMGRKQFILMLSYLGAMVLLVIVLLLIVYTWTVEDYVIYDRHEQQQQVEDIPPLTAKAVQFMYAWNGLATNMKLHLYTKWLTQWCGRRYKASLSDSGKDSQIRDAFITEYAIDMSEYNPSDYRAYSSVNEWFIRHLAPGVRPLAAERLAVASPTHRAPADHIGIVHSPADCRMLIFPTLDNSRVWIKGSNFNYGELLDGRGNWSTVFEQGSMVIARLAPQDYHRFNSPINGTIAEQWDIDGTYWSVNADAAKSKNYAFYNLRRVVIMRYTKPSGAVKHLAYVAIGATCVGSVVFTYDATAPIPAGGELGFMQFGGSTVIILMEKDELIPDDDIVYNSAKPVESYIKVGERLGILST